MTVFLADQNVIDTMGRFELSIDHNWPISTIYHKSWSSPLFLCFLEVNINIHFTSLFNNKIKNNNAFTMCVNWNR